MEEFRSMHDDESPRQNTYVPALFSSSPLALSMLLASIAGVDAHAWELEEQNTTQQEEEEEEQ